MVDSERFFAVVEGFYGCGYDSHGDVVVGSCVYHCRCSDGWRKELLVWGDGVECRSGLNVPR